MRPLIARKVVVLPAPLAPISVTICFRLDLERDAFQRLDVVVGHPQVVDLE